MTNEKQTILFGIFPIDNCTQIDLSIVNNYKVEWYSCLKERIASHLVLFSASFLLINRIINIKVIDLLRRVVTDELEISHFFIKLYLKPTL